MTPPPKIFDRARIARRLARRKGAPDFITELVAADLAERLAPISRSFSNALVIGPDADMLPGSGASAAGQFGFTRRSTLIARSGQPPLDPDRFEPGRADYDLIVSLLDLQMVNDVPGFLAALRAHLAPDGLMMAAAIGGRSLTELREAWLAADAEMSGGASPRVAPMIDVRDAGSLLQRAGFALPVTDLETHIVRYADPLALFDELRALGASNPMIDRDPRPVTRARLMRASQIYAERHADPDGRTRATLEILWLSGWAPHESQQKPLKPGTAQTSLREALKDRSR